MTNTVNQQQTSASLQLTDFLLGWQAAQSPSSRKVPVSQLNAYYARLDGSAPFTGAVTVQAGGVAVTGNSSVTGTLTTTAGMTVQAGGVAVTGNSTIAGTLATTGQISASGTITGNVVNSSTSIAAATTIRSGDATDFVVLNPTGSMQQQVAAFGSVISAYTSGATFLGQIVGSGAGGVLYQTASDYRLKDVYGPADAGQMIDAIPVHDAAFKAKPDERRPMVLAHELAAVAPWCVTGEKDAVDENGQIMPQQVGLIDLVPALIAEIQALRRRVAQLEAR